MSNLPRDWNPLAAASRDDFPPDDPAVVTEVAKHHGLTEDEARFWLQQDHAKTRYFVNDLYQVKASNYGPGDLCMHIEIRCRDGGMFKDWRHFQQIKNEVAGPEREAVEIYPAESRKVDTANKWHLWVQPDGTRIEVGWGLRDVDYDERRDIPEVRQRPL